MVRSHYYNTSHSIQILVFPSQLFGLREKLQENPIFHGKIWLVSGELRFSLRSTHWPSHPKWLFPWVFSPPMAPSSDIGARPMGSNQVTAGQRSQSRLVATGETLGIPGLENHRRNGGFMGFYGILWDFMGVYVSFMGVYRILWELPSGNDEHNYGKWPLISWIFPLNIVI